MKTITIAAFAAIALAMPAQADVETVKTLFEGSHNVTWETTLNIEASEFAEGVEKGHYISVEVSNPTDVIEFKSNGTWLLGSVYTRLYDSTT